MNLACRTPRARCSIPSTGLRIRRGPGPLYTAGKHGASARCGSTGYRAFGSVDSARPADRDGLSCYSYSPERGYLAPQMRGSDAHLLRLTNLQGYVNLFT